MSNERKARGLITPYYFILDDATNHDKYPINVTEKESFDMSKHEEHDLWTKAFKEKYSNVYNENDQTSMDAKNSDGAFTRLSNVLKTEDFIWNANMSMHQD